jgi:hypothetical protein
VSVSHSGGVLQHPEPLLARVHRRLESEGARYRVLAPRLPPAAGAALYAARLSGAPLSAQAVDALEHSLRAARR